MAFHLSPFFKLYSTVVPFLDKVLALKRAVLFVCDLSSYRISVNASDNLCTAGVADSDRVLALAVKRKWALLAF